MPENPGMSRRKLIGLGAVTLAGAALPDALFNLSSAAAAAAGPTEGIGYFARFGVTEGELFAAARPGVDYRALDEDAAARAAILTGIGEAADGRVVPAVGVVEQAGRAVMFVLTVLPTVLVVLMLLGLFQKSRVILALKSFTGLLFSSGWHPLRGEFGLFPFLMGTLWVTAVALIIAIPISLLTAIYMFRLVFLAFWGEGRMDGETAHHVHESPRVMTVPLVVLGVLSVAGGWVGIPKVLSFGADLNGFEHYLAPVFESGAGEGAHHASAGLEYGLMALALGVVAAGIFLAYRFYLASPEVPKRLALRFPVLARLLVNKYYVDEFYARAVVDPYMALCRWFHAFDARVVDGLVNGSRHCTVGLSHVSRFFDQWVVDGLVNTAAYTTRGLSLAFRRLQTGLVQAYLSVFVFGIFLFVSLYLFWQR